MGPDSRQWVSASGLPVETGSSNDRSICEECEGGSKGKFVILLTAENVDRQTNDEHYAADTPQSYDRQTHIVCWSMNLLPIIDRRRLEGPFHTSTFSVA